MRFFNAKRNFRIMRHRRVTAIVSAILIVLCVISLATRQLNFSVDFTGGTLVEIQLSEVYPTETIRSQLTDIGLEKIAVQLSADNTVLIRLPVSDQTYGDIVFDSISILDSSAELRQVEFVGPQVSEELFTTGIFALIVVCSGIIVYLSLRFKWRMAVGAIVANMHDVVFILGAFSIFGWEFSLPVLAGVLAILGYSVNETVVIFDRVRENLQASRAKQELTDIIDASITQTWSRTIITHGSTQLAVLAMLLFGGEALFFFAVALTIGIFSSIYSSILIASPVALKLGLARSDFISLTKNKSDGAIV